MKYCCCKCFTSLKRHKNKQVSFDFIGIEHKKKDLSQNSFFEIYKDHEIFNESKIISDNQREIKISNQELKFQKEIKILNEELHKVRKDYEDLLNSKNKIEENSEKSFRSLNQNFKELHTIKEKLNERIKHLEDKNKAFGR
jgi:predicted  nucleic acid-binding Zn-ribbon protein